MKKFDVVLAGVGGQGLLTASKIIGQAAIIEGLKVRGSELKGLAQRGGSVVGHIRMGDEVESPLVMQGAADVLLGFEPVEAFRQVHYLSPQGLAIVNTRPVTPYFVSIGKAQYPNAEVLFRAIRSYARAIVLDATSLAQQAGSLMATNVVMLGAFAGVNTCPLRKESILKALQVTIRPSALEISVRAFELGFNKVVELQRA